MGERNDKMGGIKHKRQGDLIPLPLELEFLYIALLRFYNNQPFGTDNDAFRVNQTI